MDEKCFDDLYKELSLISKNGLPLPIHRSCMHKAECWKGSHERYPPDTNEQSHISRPWVGPRFGDLRIVAIGENLNGYGGLNALVELAEEAKELIAQGRIRVRFHAAVDQYAGSFLWHRLGCYSAAVAEHFGSYRPHWGDAGYPTAEDVSKAYDFIAYLEHVKCSPIGQKSKPTSAMWEHCGVHILRRELELLRPSHLLVFGVSNNAWYMRERVLDSGFDTSACVGAVQRASGRIGGHPVSIWIVPHPQSYGGSSRQILDDLKRVFRA